MHVFDGLGLSSAAVDLGPAGDAGTDVMAYHVLLYLGAVVFGMGEHVWTGADETHVTLEDIDKLGEFVDIGFTQEMAEAGNAGVIFGGLQFVTIAVDFHATELETVEIFAIDTGTFLTEVDGAGAGYFSDNGHGEINERIDCADKKTGDNDVQSTLDQSFIGILQWLKVEGEQRDIADVKKGGTTSEVALDIGDDIEMDDIHLTVLQYFLKGGEFLLVDSTIDFVYTMILKILEGFIRGFEGG